MDRNWDVTLRVADGGSYGNAGFILGPEVPRERPAPASLRTQLPEGPLAEGGQGQEGRRSCPTAPFLNLRVRRRPPIETTDFRIETEVTEAGWMLVMRQYPKQAVPE